MLGAVYVVRTAFRGRQPTPDGQTDSVQTNQTLSVVNLSAVHWHGTELKLTARQISKKEQNSSVRRRPPVRCRWLGTVLEFTDSVQTNRILSVIILSAVRWLGPDGWTLLYDIGDLAEVTESYRENDQ